MFFEGDLQAGIGKAVQESKSVLCFITDGNEECEKWEKEWLQDHNLPTSIEAKAVALRLDASSQQAEYLAAFCPISSVPFIVVIYQGQVEEQLSSGLTKNDFILRLLRALSRSERSPQPKPAPDQTPPVAESASATDSNTSREIPTAQPAAAPAIPVDQSQPSPSSSNTAAASLAADRRRRVEAQQAQVAAAEKAERAKTNERARIRREAAEGTGSEVDTNDRVSDPSVVAQQAAYARQEQSRKKARESERDRILKQVEYDKQERRDRAEQRRQAAAAAKAEAAGESSPLPSTPASAPRAPTSFTTTTPTPPATAKDTRIAIRLLDSTALRHTLPPSTPLSTLRSHIDANRTDGDAPYTLKHLLTPLPSRALTDTDAASTLQELGLHPSATLVMSPVQGFAAAYSQAQAAPAAAAGTALQSVWAYVIGVVVLVVGWVRTFLDVGDAAPRAQGRERGVEREGAGATGVGGKAVDGSGSGIRIRTWRDKGEEGRAEREKGEDKGKQPLYNGNQLNFEPRDDDADQDGGDL